VQADEQSIGRVAELQKELGSQEAKEQSVGRGDEVQDRTRQGNSRSLEAGLRCENAASFSHGPPLPFCPQSTVNALTPVCMCLDAEEQALARHWPRAQKGPVITVSAVQCSYGVCVVCGAGISST